MIELILIPLAIGALTQILKLSIDGIPNNLNWQHLLTDYGGMPSSHTAFVASLVTIVGIREGINSAAFAVALVFMLIVIRDAVGFRREIGKNAILTNALTKEVFKNKKTSPPLLKERIGHTVPEVIAGLLVGCSLTVVLYLILIII
ncbi:MAG: divergent PAP2 family protein [Patescibacteria group bacterium]